MKTSNNDKKFWFGFGFRQAGVRCKIFGSSFIPHHKKVSSHLSPPPFYPFHPFVFNNSRLSRLAAAAALFQEGIPAMVADSIHNGDKKMSYYREHTHALASGVDAGRVMGELFAKDGGTCRGAGGSMHIYDKDTHFQVFLPGVGGGG